MFHEFDGSNAIGKVGEEVLDSLFQKFYTIEPVTRDKDWRGIDRMYKPKDGRPSFGVQYKTDMRCGTTGNLFIEDVSNDTSGRKGCTHTCEARLLMYYALPLATIFVFDTDVLRRMLPEWKSRHGTKPAVNAHYRTLGVCVPICEAAGHAFISFKLKAEPQ